MGEWLDVGGMFARGVRTDVVPGFTLKKKVGEGAMGAVFMAVEDETGEKAAVKFLSPEYSRDKSVLTRLDREFAISEKLRHPNVVRGFSQGSTDGVHYIVFEYVDGESLDGIIKKERTLDEKRAASILYEIAKGLEAANQMGVIHRDIKPANIMIAADGAVKITDFGLAKREADPTVTALGALVGTPTYRSPEQVQCRDNLDIRTDLYSLGITGYVMLTGRPPFTDTSLPLLLTKKVVEEIPSPRSVDPRLSDGICRIVATLSRKDRENRYESPAEVIRELEKYSKEPCDETTPLLSGEDDVHARETVLLPGGDEADGAPNVTQLPDVSHPVLKSLLMKEGVPLKTFRLEKGEVLFLEGDPSRDAYVLLAGGLEVLKAGRTIASVSNQGDFVGEISSLMDTPRTATIRASETSFLLKIKEGEFDRVLRTAPSFAHYLLKSMAEKLAATTNDLEYAQSKLSSLSYQVKLLAENL